MATYICKCGREVIKSTTADNTGNRDTAGCVGCPYLLPYGKFEYKPGGFQTDVQGYECRMSPSIDYTTTYMGQVNDKCTLRIVSLDFDFLDEVQAWINTHADGNLSGGFSREAMRGTDFSNNGRYSWSIACAQNRKGMAAKAALIEHFFGLDRHRLDLTPDEEKSKVLADIEKGKAKANKKEKKMDYIISECDQNDLVYAYYKNEFWYWDENQSKWIVSDFARDRFEKALKDSSELTPEDFMTNCDEFWELDEWEVSTEQINALELVKVERKSTESDGELIKEGTDVRRQVHSRARIECGSISAIHVCDTKPDDVKIWLNAMAPAEYWVLNSGDDPCGEHIEVCPYCGAKLNDGAGDVLIVPFYCAAESQQNCKSAAIVQHTEESESPSADEPVPLIENDQNAFDYSGLDDQTVVDLHLAEREYSAGKKLTEMGLHRMADAVAIAHDALCGTVVQMLDNSKHGNRGEDTFRAWCASMGMSKSTAYSLLQVSAAFMNSSPEQQKVMEQLPTTLLYDYAKPSTTEEMKENILSGDITTHKQYQEAMAKIRSLESENKQLKYENEMERKEQANANAAALRYKNECDRRARDQKRVEGQLNTLDVELKDAQSCERTYKAEMERLAAENAALAKKLKEQVQPKPTPAELDAETMEEIRRQAIEETKQAEAAARQKLKDKLEKAAAEKEEAVRHAREEAAKQAQEEAAAAVADQLAKQEAETAEATKRAEELAKRLELTDIEEATEFRLLFGQIQQAADRMSEIVELMDKGGYAEQAEKLRKALCAALRALMEQMEGSCDC